MACNSMLPQNDKESEQVDKARDFFCTLKESDCRQKVTSVVECRFDMRRK